VLVGMQPARLFLDKTVVRRHGLLEIVEQPQVQVDFIGVVYRLGVAPLNRTCSGRKPAKVVITEPLARRQDSQWQCPIHSDSPSISNLTAPQ
jgi:hypothetical protein